MVFWPWFTNVLADLHCQRDNIHAPDRCVKHIMEYLDNIGEKVGLGNVDLDDIKRQASFYLRDKFKSARLLLTDVTPSQL